MPDSASNEFIALQQAVAGRYSLERELGRGGMGIVFLARDVALDRPVAIKLLPPALGARAGLTERFVHEARTAARLSHPNIVPIHAVDEAGGMVFFVMSFVDGETLGDRLRDKGPLTPHEAARLVQEVAWALGYAHGRGVVHRDIKPDNIMLERASGRAIVMDFGIAGAAGGAAEHFGTAQYVSPEQATGESVDGRSDLYSLGVVGFLALTGRLPFDGEDLHALLAMHVSRPAPPLLSVAPGAPRKLAQALDRCLAKAPADRFPDGEALAEAVATAVEPRRQLPVPVRLWLTKGEESRTAWVLMWFAAAGPVTSALLGAITNYLFRTNGLLIPIVAFGNYLLTPVAMYAGWRLMRLRRLLEAGYSVEDAKLAVRDLAQQRREELSYEYGGPPPLWARVDRAVMYASGGLFVATIAVGVSMHFTGPGVSWAMGLLGATWFGSAVLQTVRPGKPITRDVNVERRLRFWNGRLARWFEKLARIGLKKRAAAAELTYRPTEMAISLAADALFESLPKEQRRELKDLPQVLERLQRDAALMRKTVDELNGALAGLGEQGDAARSSALKDAGAKSDELADARFHLRVELTAKRDEAARQMAAAVGALESVRLSLLRLKAGTGDMSAVTADLSSARSVTADLGDATALTDAMNRTAHGREEVERILRPSRA